MCRLNNCVSIHFPDSSRSLSLTLCRSFFRPFSRCQSSRWGLRLPQSKWMHGLVGGRRFDNFTFTLSVEMTREHRSPALSLSLSPSLRLIRTCCDVLIKFIFSNHIGIYYVCSINFLVGSQARARKAICSLHLTLDCEYPCETVNTSKPRRNFGCILQVMMALKVMDCLHSAFDEWMSMCCTCVCAHRRTREREPKPGWFTDARTSKMSHSSMPELVL